MGAIVLCHLLLILDQDTEMAIEAFSTPHRPEREEMKQRWKARSRNVRMRGRPRPSYFNRVVDSSLFAVEVEQAHLRDVGPHRFPLHV